MLVGRGVADQVGLPGWPDALVRVRRTVPLASFAGQARWDEVAQAMMVRPSRQGLVHGRDVVLVDDLLTTGATATACTRVLLGAGARSVSLLVAGVVPARAENDLDPVG